MLRSSPILGFALWLVVFAVLGWQGWSQPASPLALTRAEALFGVDPQAAVELFDQVSEQSPWASIRARALRRAAQIYAADLESPAEARERLVGVLDLVQDPRQRARTWEDVARLDLELGQPQRAADAFVTAHNVDPGDAAAGGRLVAAANARMRAQDLDKALGLWRRIARRYPSHRELAFSAQAEIQLGFGDPARALELYQKVLAAEEDPAFTTLARLGAATCLERLGYLDDALAEIEQAELPPGVAQSRAGSMRERMRAQGGALP